MEKASHLRDMSDEQLDLTLKDATKTLFKLLIQAQTERLTSSSELRKYRRFIARIKTTQRQRELKAERQAGEAVETLITNP
jgi:large subunit ribosomal protein L29